MAGLYRIIFGIFALIFVSVPSFAQEGGASAEIDKLVSPSYPAFSIIGKSSEEVSRITEPKALATTLQNSIGDNGFITDIALEFNPFWINDTTITVNDYYGEFAEGEEKAVFQNLKRTSSFSIATARETTSINGIDIEGSNLGLGFRTQPIVGKLDETPLLKWKDFENFRQIVLDRNMVRLVSTAQPEDVETLKIKLIQEIKLIFPLDVQELEDTKKLLKEIQQAKSVEEIQQKFELYKYAERVDLLQEIAAESRYGFIVELAVATHISFPSNEFDLSYGRKTGIWITLDYRTKSGDLDFIIAPRLLFDHQNEKLNSDLGAKLVWNGKQFYLAGEIIYRYHQRRFDTFDLNNEPIQAIESSSTVRYTLNFQYKISDMLSFVGVFGKNWEDEFTGKDELISQIGIQVGLGKRLIAW